MRGLREMSLSPRYLVAVNLILLALAAYSASSIVGTALAAKLIPPPDVVLKPPPPPIEIDGTKPVVHYAVINTRDIFNSAPPPAAPVPVEAPQVTPLKLKLWGVALYQTGNSYSIIEDLGARKQGVYGINAEVPGGATVKAIEWDKVILARNGKDEILELSSVTAGLAKAGPAPAAAAAPAGNTGTIQMTAENEFLVPRTEVDSALENMSQLFTQIRAVPHFEGGQSVGFRLFAIRRGSLFDRIGLKNGDIIRSINGSEMNDPSRAVALLQELRDSSDLQVEVTRNQQPQTLTYNIR
ncbi:MAG: type II secretion system protein GspC [Candidatus Binatia bacterium]